MFILEVVCVYLFFLWFFERPLFSCWTSLKLYAKEIFIKTYAKLHFVYPKFMSKNILRYAKFTKNSHVLQHNFTSENHVFLPNDSSCTKFPPWHIFVHYSTDWVQLNRTVFFCIKHDWDCSRYSKCERKWISKNIYKQM